MGFQYYNNCVLKKNAIVLIPVKKKCSESTRIQMVNNSYQEEFVEFKCIWEHAGHLPYTIYEL